jgi:2-phosphosulfolactate phosphatase
LPAHRAAAADCNGRPPFRGESGNVRSKAVARRDASDVSTIELAMLAVHLLPSLTSPEELAGGEVVVIDVLRASTTIVHALAAGAAAVIPCLEIDEARHLAATLSAGKAVLGGERGGLPIPSFDLGNSPEEYTPKTVGGRTVVFTTTNGTQAMRQCHAAARVWIGAFVNLTAICRQLSSQRPIHLLCAGTRGQITREDALLAGALLALLTDAQPEQAAALNDQGRLALAAWREVAGPLPAGQVAARLAATLRDTQGGRNLRKIGLEHDIDTAACIDRFDLTPQLDAEAWRITVPTRSRDGVDPSLLGR